MKLLNKLKSLLTPSTTKKPSRTKCYFCKKSTNNLRSYKNEQKQTIKVCTLCVEYAERRAFQLEKR